MLSVKSYETKYKAIKDAIKQVQTVQQCAEVSANIDGVEKEFAADTVLLNKSLYPDKYDDQITEVRVELRLNQDKLGIIESSVARIAQLEEQVRSLSGKVDSLSSANDKLMASLDVMSKAVEKNTKAIDSLNHIIGDLPQGCARDEAIFAMTDSLFMQYDKNIQGLPDQEKKMLVGKMERHNVVFNVMEAAKENIKFLESTQLSGKDLYRRWSKSSGRIFQLELERAWPETRRRLCQLERSGKTIAAIDSVVAEWGKKADSALWLSLNGEFAGKQIPVKPFHSGDEFVANLSNYFDEQTNDSKSWELTNQLVSITFSTMSGIRA